jgi:hypothetical protein
MCLDVLLEILGALEALAAKVTLVRLEWNVNTDMRRDVVALDCCCSALVPLARQVQVVGALAANMLLANMLIERLSRGELLVTAAPPAGERVVRRRGAGLGSGSRGCRRSRSRGARVGALGSRLDSRRVDVGGLCRGRHGDA